MANDSIGDIWLHLAKTNMGCHLLCTALVLGIRRQNETEEERLRREGAIANHQKTLALYLTETGFGNLISSER